LSNLRRVEDVVLVISQENPSDCCSRNGPDDWKRAGGCCLSHASFEERWKRLNRCLTSRARGWNWASLSHERWIAEEAETLRHVPRAGVSRHGDTDVEDPLAEDSRDDPYILQDAEDDFGADGFEEASCGCSGKSSDDVLGRPDSCESTSFQCLPHLSPFPLARFVSSSLQLVCRRIFP
jgi:hypothetical protein